MNCCKLWDCGHERACPSRNVNADGLMRQLEECQALLVRERFVFADERRYPAGLGGARKLETLSDLFGVPIEGDAGAPDAQIAILARVLEGLEKHDAMQERIAKAFEVVAENLSDLAEHLGGVRLKADRKPRARRRRRAKKGAAK